MTALDWGIIAFVLLMALWGYMQGLIVGALSLAGFAAGAFIGSRLGAPLLEEGSSLAVRAACSRWWARCWSVASWPRAWSCSAFACATGSTTRLGVVDGLGGARWWRASGLGLVVGRGRRGAADAGRPGTCASRSSARRSCAG